MRTLSPMQWQRLAGLDLVYDPMTQGDRLVTLGQREAVNGFNLLLDVTS